MDPARSIIIGVNFPDGLKGSESQHFYADVVVIDKTQTGMKPLLYQIKDEALSQNLYNEDGAAITLAYGSFVMMGEIVTIDRKAKIIRFSSSTGNNVIQNTISYQHLVIASGLRHAVGSIDQAEAFCKGLQTLIEAARIKNKLPEGKFSPYGSLISKESRKAKILSKDEIEKMAFDCIFHHLNECDIKKFKESHPSLFEVQL
jgi:NADH dehydrogenase FAD-containing subunit